MSNTILNISQSYYVRGGSDRYFMVLEELLRREGHQVIPYAARFDKNEPTEWSKYFPPSVDFDRPRLKDLWRFVYSSPARRNLRQLLTVERPDIAHLHIYYGHLTASVLKPLRAAGVPIVQTLHDFKLVCPVYSLLSGGKICEACRGKHFWKATTRRCNRGSFARSLLSSIETYVSHALGAANSIDRFISVSNFQRDKYIELGVPAEKITTVHNFADTDGVVAADTPGDYLLYFGRIEQLKGIFTILKAARQIPHVRLLIVGSGDAEQEAKDLAAGWGLRNVEFLGFRQGDELRSLVRNSIATLIPSEGYDNCPMTVLESMALGRPVLGTRIGGIPELIDHQQDGFLVLPGDADSLADRMNWFDQHRDEALEMGAVARAKMEDRFSRELHYDKLLDVYRQVSTAFSQQVPESVSEPVAT